ncbi:MAG: N-acetylmuramoyl-L-alanine amidase [Muribaculaceae bacterium]|nr:N-acetylmuramoyl-L-alanine amidase [Muribaculaceae bacterium]
MNNLIKKSAVAAAMLMACGMTAGAQDIDAGIQAQILEAVNSCKPEKMQIGELKVLETTVAGDTVKVNLSENFGDVPFTTVTIDKLRTDIKDALGAPFAHHQLQILIDGADIENYFTNFETSYKRKHSAFITENDPNRHYKKALDGNIIALWPSHGWYFEPKLNRWEWQRARMFQTVEDMYTHSYVLPFLMPMLENAGAYVWDARERDTHNFGAVVDNDGGVAQKSYRETSGEKHWEQGAEKGFSFARPTYRDFENPFAEGTYRQVAVTKDKKKVSTAHWDVDMPEAGEFAIYISYKSLPNSVKDAHYTVNDQSGTKNFTVDQTMAGGVWVYLTTVSLKKGLNKDVVVLSNMSNAKDGVITADAIRVGGGKGNIERRVALPTPENKKLAKSQGNSSVECLGKDGVDYKYVGSGEHPWFHIGARYYMQWSGFPKEVYSESNGINDYTDDYKDRGLWVNYLAGGSDVLPKAKGLNVPVDLSFCLHTDAGTTPNDDIIGTLLIYSTTSNGKNFAKYANGTPRELSRQYANLVSTEIVNDIRAKYEPNWTRRGMWDKAYYEARTPEVPAILIELLSHQNFADMKYGLDPMFRFDVSRSIYKGMVKFLAQRDHRDYEIQPLPVNSFSISEVDDNSFKLTWKATRDELCDKADAKKYIVCERVDDGAFKEISVVTEPECVVKVTDNNIHSYRIIAVNDGGRSFPSETLSLGVAQASKGTVMVVNNFTRVSGPDWVDGKELAGFVDGKDHGVPYIQQINYLGAQHEFRRNLDWRDDDAPGFGACRSNHETEVIAGNTFDYPYVHGKAIMNAGYSFISSSAKAVEDAPELLSGCHMLDLIMGKQKEVPTGRGAKPSRFKAFTPELMSAVKSYTQNGGCVFMSGAYVATDIWDKKAPVQAEKDFAENVMGYTYMDGAATLKGEVYSVPTVYNAGSMPDGVSYTFVNQLNDKVYAVESPDAIKASDKKGSTWLRYSENNIPAGIVSARNGYRTVVMGFPFEVMPSEQQRNDMMANILKWLLKE